MYLCVVSFSLTCLSFSTYPSTFLSLLGQLHQDSLNMCSAIPKSTYPIVKCSNAKLWFQPLKYIDRFFTFTKESSNSSLLFFSWVHLMGNTIFKGKKFYKLHCQIVTILTQYGRIKIELHGNIMTHSLLYKVWESVTIYWPVSMISECWGTLKLQGLIISVAIHANNSNLYKSNLKLLFGIK